jgi:DeoR/GlpR family transcriptional regulator of sugar metabolism
MRTGQRKREILRRLYLTGYVEAKELATGLGVDGSTIRRDLDALAREGHLQRTHGGARARAGAIDVPYAVKRGEHMAAKQAVGSFASGLVQDGDSLVLDSGSTTYQLALALAAHRNLTIVTNDMLVGQAVADYPGVRLLVTGGELLTFTYTLFGDRAVAFVEDLRVDWTFLGADAIDLASGITNTNTLEIPLKRAMLGVARTTFVLADSSKFGKHALVRVAGIDEIDRIISDDGLDPAIAQALGERLLLAPLEASAAARPADPSVA